MQQSADTCRSMDKAQDKEWQQRVTMLESELKETKDYYLKRIEALEKGNNVFTDSSILVAGESVADKTQTPTDVNKDGGCLSNRAFCESYEQHYQRLKQDQQLEADNMRQQAQDRQLLYEKLSMAEQVLEQITEELQLLSAENKFLTKLNQRLTYHACR